MGKASKEPFRSIMGNKLVVPPYKGLPRIYPLPANDGTVVGDMIGATKMKYWDQT